MYKKNIYINKLFNRSKELESLLRFNNSLYCSLALDYSDLKKRYSNLDELLTRKLAENSRLTLENEQLKEQIVHKEELIKELQEEIIYQKNYVRQELKLQRYLFDVNKKLKEELNKYKG